MKPSKKKGCKAKVPEAAKSIGRFNTLLPGEKTISSSLSSSLKVHYFPEVMKTVTRADMAVSGLDMQIDRAETFDIHRLTKASRANSKRHRSAANNGEHPMMHWLKLRTQYMRQLDELVVSVLFMNRDQMEGERSNFLRLLLSLRKVTARIVDDYLSQKAAFLTNEGRGDGEDIPTRTMTERDFIMVERTLYAAARGVECTTENPFLRWCGVKSESNPFFMSLDIFGNNTSISSLSSSSSSAHSIAPELILTEAEDIRRYRRIRNSLAGLVAAINENIYKFSTGESSLAMMQKRAQGGDAVTTALERREAEEAARQRQAAQNVDVRLADLKKKYASSGVLVRGRIMGVFFRIWRRQYSIELAIKDMYMAKERRYKRKVFNIFLILRWQCARFRHLQVVRNRRRIDMMFYCWLRYLSWCRKFNALHSKADVHIQRFFFARMVGFVRTTFDTRRFRMSVNRRRMETTLECLRYNAILGKYSLQQRLKFGSDITFCDSTVFTWCFKRWKERCKVIFALDQLETSVRMFDMKRAFVFLYFNLKEGRLKEGTLFSHIKDAMNSTKTKIVTTMAGTVTGNGGSGTSEPTGQAVMISGMGSAAGVTAAVSVVSGGSGGDTNGGSGSAEATAPAQAPRPVSTGSSAIVADSSSSSSCTANISQEPIRGQNISSPVPKVKIDVNAVTPAVAASMKPAKAAVPVPAAVTSPVPVPVPLPVPAAVTSAGSAVVATAAAAAAAFGVQDKGKKKGNDDYDKEEEEEEEEEGAGFMAAYYKLLLARRPLNISADDDDEEVQEEMRTGAGYISSSGDEAAAAGGVYGAHASASTPAETDTAVHPSPLQLNYSFSTNGSALSEEDEHSINTASSKTSGKRSMKVAMSSFMKSATDKARSSGSSVLDKFRRNGKKKGKKKKEYTDDNSR